MRSEDPEEDDPQDELCGLLELWLPDSDAINRSKIGDPYDDLRCELDNVFKKVFNE